MKKAIKSIYQEQVSQVDVINHYTVVTQLEIRLKNIAIHQIEKRRHEKAKEMLRQTFRKIHEEHKKYNSLTSVGSKSDFYSMIMNDITNLQNARIAKAND